uniref:Centromere protein X n=1 Tax=Kalanchoe fedtschenkoi TaxID=63787 RepID=A0A7N0SX36_KALFE
MSDGVEKFSTQPNRLPFPFRKLKQTSHSHDDTLPIPQGTNPVATSSQLRFSTSMEPTFDPDLVHAIFKRIWIRKAAERERNDGADMVDSEAGAAGAVSSKRNRPTSANSSALKLSCELLKLFVAEAVNRAATIAEAEGSGKIEATHLERILPQLLLDF